MCRDQEPEEMDEEQREIMSRLVNSRADRIIEAAHKGAFEPRGGIVALSGPMGRQRVVEALMVRRKNCRLESLAAFVRLLSFATIVSSSHSCLVYPASL